MKSKEEYFSVHRIALLALLTAMSAVGRLMFALPFLPNIQPMTAMFLIVALNIGIYDSLIVSLLSMLLTNLFLGMGPWTIMQIISFAAVILLTGLLKIFYQFGNLKIRFAFAIWALIVGFLYGFVISYLNFHLYGLNNFLVYYINGLPFDLMHGLGNFGFFLILEPILVPIIENKFYDVLQ